MNNLVFMSFQVPIPTNNIEILWVLLGMSFGRNFGKKLDQGIQAHPVYLSLDPAIQGFIKRILDFTHHWWMGAILWLYAHLWIQYLWPSFFVELKFFGVGLFLDDIRDFKHVLSRYKKATNNGEE